MLTSMGIMLIPVIMTVIVLLVFKFFNYTNDRTCHIKGNGVFMAVWVITGVVIVLMTAGMWWFYPCVVFGAFAFSWTPLAWWVYCMVISLLLHGVFYLSAKRS